MCIKERRNLRNLEKKISKAQKGRKKSELKLQHLREANKITAEKTEVELSTTIAQMKFAYYPQTIFLKDMQKDELNRN